MEPRTSIPLMSLLLYFGATSASAAGSSPVCEGDRVVVEGPGVTITCSQLREEISLVSERQRRMAMTSDEHLRQLLNEMYVRSRMAVVAQEQGYLDDPQVQAELRRARERALTSAVTRLYGERLDVPDLREDARAHYEENIEQFTVPLQVNAAHILLAAPNAEDKTRRRPEAEALLRRLEEGADFADLAREHGEDDTKEIGGNLGYFGRGKMVPEFEEAVFDLDEGDVALVETRFGFHLVKLLDRRGGDAVPYAEVEGRILERLRAEYVRKALTDWLTANASPAEAAIDGEALAALFDEISTQGANTPAAVRSEPQAADERVPAESAGPGGEEGLGMR